ncbi:MAG: hypothetical protein JWM36_4356 [Hyphomicrobiales bacterium]|nr:hypothetical protein [Hyphomicrobiales bacterium]
MNDSLHEIPIRMELNALRIELRTSEARVAHLEAEQAKVSDWIPYLNTQQETIMSRLDDVEQALSSAKTNLDTLGGHVQELQSQKDQAKADATRLDGLLVHVQELDAGIKAMLPEAAPVSPQAVAAQSEDAPH